jgi:hypothetical protein
MRFSVMLKRGFFSGILTSTTAVILPLTPAVHAASLAPISQALNGSCYSKPEVLQGYHLDGSIDHTSILPVTVTYCTGKKAASLVGDSLQTSSRLRFALSLIRLADYVAQPGQIPMGPNGNGCGNGVEGNAAGKANSGSAYAHFFYVNPNDGQTIDYLNLSLDGFSGQSSWDAGVGPPSNVNLTSAGAYYSDLNHPWTIDGTYCGSL